MPTRDTPPGNIPLDVWHKHLNNWGHTIHIARVFDDQFIARTSLGDKGMQGTLSDCTAFIAAEAKGLLMPHQWEREFLLRHGHPVPVATPACQPVDLDLTLDIDAIIKSL